MKQIFLAGVLAAFISVPGLLAQARHLPKDEVDAYNAMIQAQTADARIAAAENFVTKFPDSPLKPTALYFEAVSYEQKGDYPNTVVFGERTLEADPNHYEAMLLLAGTIAQHTREYDLDRAEKLAKVAKYANGALELLKTAPKPNPNLTDDRWEAAKKDMASEAHAALGMAALATKKYDVAETEFKAAIDGAADPDPATMVRLGRTYEDDGKYDDAVAQFNKVMALPNVDTRIKQIAQAERVRALQAKGALKPAAPAAPAKPEPPKPEPPKQ